MQRTYACDDKRYLVGVTLTGWFCLALVVVCLALASPLISFLPPLMVALSVVAAYGAWNTFAAHAYPKSVTISDEELSFCSFGRIDAWRIADIETLSVRETSQDNAYVRVNGGSLVRGRYWIRGDYMEDGMELRDALGALECRINPESLRSQARRR